MCALGFTNRDISFSILRQFESHVPFFTQCLLYPTKIGLAASGGGRSVIDVRVPYFIKRPLRRRPPSIVEVRLPKIPKCSHILRTRRGEEVAPASERVPTIAWGRNSPNLPPSVGRSVRQGTYGARAHFAQVQNFTLAIDGGGDAMAWADLRSERNGRRAEGQSPWGQIAK